MITKRKVGATQRARQLRRDDTEAEYRLWGDLRNRLLNGHKFARQIPVGPYLADFVCRQARLIVEVDGGQHSESTRDEARTRFLSSHGYAVLRFWNHEVLRERKAVLETILAALEGRLAPSPGLRFAPATLSPRGEETAGRDAAPISARVGGARVDAASSSPLGERVAAQRPGEGAS